MLDGIRQLKGISFLSTIAQSVQARKRALPIFSRFTRRCKRNFGERGKRIAETSLLYEPSSPRYPQMEKLAFVLIIVARKLKPYFQAHTIVVLTDKHLRKAMSSPEAAGRMALWAVELNDFDIQYRPRTAVKGQVLADFIAEFTIGDGQGAEEKRQWNIYTDGSSNRRAGGAGVVIQTPEGDKIRCMI